MEKLSQVSNVIVRRRVIHQTNYRDRHGISLENSEKKEFVHVENESCSFKGVEFWKNCEEKGKDHFEIMKDVECSIKMCDGTYAENCLMDEIFTSYLVPVKKVQVQISVEVSSELTFEMTQENFAQLQGGEKTLNQFLLADIFVKKNEAMGDGSIDIGGDYEFKLLSYKKEG
jgi:hypothetical protein